MIEQIGRIGRYASSELKEDGEYVAGQILPGVRWDSIEVRLTRRDFQSAEIQQWLKMHLFQRVARLGKTPINITVVC